MPSKSQPDRFLNYQQAADLLGVHVTTLKKGKCGTGSIPRIKLGSRVLFSFNAIQSWMAARAREAEEAKHKSQSVIADLLSDKQRQRRAVERTLLTIINGGNRR